MMLRNGLRILFFFLFILLFSHSPSQADTNVGGRISADTTWTLAGSPYIATSTVQVYGTAATPVTLTIEPGVVVKFASSAGLQIANGTNQGALVARGTSTDRITFTRSGTSGTWSGLTFYDGTVDSTTMLENVDIQYGANITITSASPKFKDAAVTNMTGIVSLTYSSAVLENVIISNSGLYGIYLSSSSPVITGGSITNTNTTGYGVGMVSSNPTLTNVVIVNNGTYGMKLTNSSPVISGGSLTNTNIAGQGIYGSGSPVISDYSVSIVNSPGKYGVYSSSTTSALSITNSTIANGIYISSVSITPTVTGNTFTNADNSPIHAGANIIGSILNNNTVTNMTLAGKIEVLCERVNQNAQWKNWSAPYVVVAGPGGSAVSIYKDTTSSATLTIDAGVVVKFNTGTALQIGAGSNKGMLIARGAPDNRIMFTSNQAAPAPGNWSGITLNGASSSGSILEYVTIEYGGSGGAYGNANLKFDSSSPAIRNCVIRNSAGSGIYLSSANASPAITDCTISNNKWGVYSISSNPVTSNSSIIGNTTAGVWNATPTAAVDARGNWWGAASGPTHASNPSGTGDIISSSVLYSPWLTQELGTSSVTISDTKAQPSSLNPEGDYILFTASISEQANWTVVIADSNSTAVRHVTGSGAAVNVQWHGDDDVSQKVADGSYYYWIEAVSIATGAQASSAQGLLMVSRQIPVAIMDAPADNQMIASGTVISITGTAVDSTDFKSYTLQYGAGDNPSSWTLLKTGTAPVMSGLLHSWDTTTLTADHYSLKLTVTDNANNTAVETARVRLLWIQNAAATESYISPNGDAIKDSVSLSASFNYQSNWTITIKNASGTAVRTFTGTGTSLSQAWDGKDGAGVVVADGSYTYQIDAVSTETNVAAAAKTGAITVDNTNPTAQITSPASGAVLRNVVDVIGTASDMDFDTYTVEYGPAEGTGPWTAITTATSSVSNGTLATWTTNDQTNTVLLQNGGYSLKLTATDKAGNSFAATVPVNTDNLVLSGVSINSHSLDTYAAQTNTISYSISGAGTVTFKIVPEKQGPSGSPIYQTFQAVAAAGSSSFTWAGKDGTGKIVPDEAYLYILEASDGTRTDAYNPPQPTGTGTVACSQSSSFDPKSNQPMIVTYTPGQASRVSIKIAWGYEKFTVLDAFAATSGSHTFEWNGRDPDGNLLGSDAHSSCTVASLLRENYIITAGDTPVVSTVKTDPYTMSFSYGHITRIKYALSRDAVVTVQLISPNGTVITLINSQLQSAGPHEIDWDGRDPVDETGKKTLALTEGDYLVSIRAVNPDTGASSTTGGNLRILQ